MKQLFASLLLAAATLRAQQAIVLPVVGAPGQAAAQRFSFASDGPVGPGWGRPDEIARSYPDETLPALFERTLALDRAVPQRGKLSWIFTGPHAGFTVDLTPTKVRLVERYYNSMGLGGGGNYPERVIHDDEQQYTGTAKTLTVIVDAHLAVRILVNGVELLHQACMFDIARHQLQFSGPREEHLVLSGALLSSPAQNTTVRVNPAVRHQVMQGFGGSPSIPTYAAMSDAGKDQYWALLRRYNLLIDREYPMGSELKPDGSNREDLHDATPHYYGDNFPNGEVSSFDYNKRAQEIGGQVIYEMWALPPYAQSAYAGPAVTDAWNKHIRMAARPEEYVRLMLDYCRAAKARTGSAPAIVGIQNETEQPPEVFARMTLLLRSELDRAGFQSTKIQMADAPYTHIAAARARDLRANAAAWAATDFAAAHEYDYQEFLANPDLYDAKLRALHDAIAGKPFLATEICINDPRYQEPSYRIAFQVGQLYNKNLTELDAEMLLYCWLILDVEEPTFGSSRSLLVPDKTNGYAPTASSFELRVLGAYSRHVLRGMVRVDSASNNPDLLTAAFADSARGTDTARGSDAARGTLIVQNRSTVPQSLDIAWPGQHWTEIERTGSTVANQTSSMIPAHIVVAPGEIVTLSNFNAAN